MSFLRRTSAEIPRIIVVGGGAGGLELVTSLGKALGKPRKARVYLVDGTPTHVWKPLLHEVATGTFNLGQDELNYFSHGYTNKYRYHYGWMTGLDRSNKKIQMGPVIDNEGNEIHAAREVAYDTLIMAVGAKTNSFGAKGVYENCFRLDSQTEAIRLRTSFLNQTLQVAFKKTPYIKVGIVGAGPTGVELACEIHHKLGEMHAYGASINKEQLEITIMEASPTILPGFPEHIQKYAENELKERGIAIQTNSKIQEVNQKGFVMADGKILEKCIKIWTAGIKAPAWLRNIGLELDPINRIKVDCTLKTEDPDIFAFGDCANCPDPLDLKKSRPATAQCAHQQAEWLAKKIMNDMKGKPTKQPFSFIDMGVLVSLGHDVAVGMIKGNYLTNRQFRVSGRPARLIYSSLYRMHQAASYGNANAVGILLGDRLRKRTRPKNIIFI